MGNSFTDLYRLTQPCHNPSEFTRFRVEGAKLCYGEGLGPHRSERLDLHSQAKARHPRPMYPKP